MKAFTTVMKIAILIVTIALVAMLAISTIPLVTGGVNVEKVEEISINPNGATINITGHYNVVSSIDQDISDLVIEAYLLSRDGNVKKDLISVGPITINKENPNADIIIDSKIPIAEVALFFVTDNMNKETPGLSLPVTLHVKGSYSSNLAGIDMRLVYNIPLSDTGQFSIGNTKTTASGEVSHAEIELSGIAEGQMLDSLVPNGESSLSLELPGGKAIEISIDKDSSGNVKLTLGTGDEDNDSIAALIEQTLDMLKNESTDSITFSYETGGDSGGYTFSPSDIKDSEKAEEAKKYISQLEGVSSSLESLLEKYKSMSGGA